MHLCTTLKLITLEKKPGSQPAGQQVNKSVVVLGTANKECSGGSQKQI